MPAPLPFGTADYQQAMIDLLPRGRAWNHRLTGILASVLGALAPTYARSTAAAIGLLTDTLPTTTINLLPDWEASLGLPDPCAGSSPTVQQRLAQVAARWGGRGGQSQGYFIQFAAALGYPITITQFAPYRCGMALGLPLYGVAWAFAWQINAPTFSISYFEVGRDAVGEAFSTWGNTVLQCEMQRQAPAHTIPLFSYH